MKLHVPKEPEHTKEWIRSIEQQTGGGTNIRWDRLNVWYGLDLQKYLWSEWKDELKEYGFTWQKFLHLLRQRTDSILMWYRGYSSWEKFVKETIELLNGPLGKEVGKG